MNKKTEGSLRGVRSVNTVRARRPVPARSGCRRQTRMSAPPMRYASNGGAGIPACPVRSAGLAERRTLLKAALSC